MNTVEILNRYLHSAERRLKVFALSRGAAVTALVALGLTIGLAFIANEFAFSAGIVLVSRLLLFLALAMAVTFVAIVPLTRLNRRNAARRIEHQYPEFQQRLLTFAEDRDTANPFLPLLASETAEVAQRAQAERIAPRPKLLGWLASAAGAAAVLIWLIAAGPGYLGYGASLLWAGPPKAGAEPLYNIVVTPGDRTVRRRTDQLITAQLVGFDTKQVRLKARFGAGTKWEEVAMLPQPGAGAYEFLFAALPDSVEYYVEARGIRSKPHTLSVIDLPGIKNFKVTYHYPSWSGLKDATEDPGGDLRAVEGTVAELTVTSDAPIKNGIVAIDENTAVKLTGEGNTLRAEVPIRKDGMYHFAAIDRDQPVRLSEDYFIEARKDNAPVVKLTRPGRDAKVNPIEEVPLAVEAEDDFGLREVALHYSVNGAEEKTVKVPVNGAKQASGKHTLALEDFKLVPGDIVAVYATANDARNVAKTDIFFVEAQPFEREYSQSQQAGGGGGGGDQDQDGQITAREKEIIAATWNELKGRAAQNAAESAEHAKFLSDVQAKLRDQAKSMSERAKSRALAGVNQEFQNFVKSMDEAVKEMSAASDRLKAQDWKGALPPSQRALQQAARAEAVFRQIQVAMGRNGGAGGGRGGAARDLDNLFDLELDTEKNQYETGQQSASADQRQRDIDEALQKLEELARRQQELAKEQKQAQQSFQQRWEQEQLRREAEELRKKLDQLTRGDQQSSSQSTSSSSSGQQSSGQQSSGQQSSSQQSPAQQSRQNGRPQPMQLQRNRSIAQQQSDQRLREAFNRLTQATDDMRKSASPSEQGNAGARRAADRLQEAKDLLRGLRQQQSAGQLDDLQQRAEELASSQRNFADKMRKAFGAGQPEADLPPQSFGGRRQQQFQQPIGSGQEWQQAQQMAGEKERMGQQLDDLQRDTQKAARDLAGSQPAASSKLREGLGQLQQDEVRMRMKFAADWIRRGRGSYLVAGESVAAMDLNKLADSIKEAKAALGKDGDKPAGSTDAEKALSRVERLREQLERATQARQQGQQAGEQQGNQQGGQQQGNRQGNQQGNQQGGQQQGGQQQVGQQSGSQQGGQQPGGQQQTGAQQGGQRQFGSNGGDYRGGAFNRGPLPDAPNYRAGDAEGAIRSAVRDLNSLRRQIGPSTDMGRQIGEVVRDLQRPEYALAGPALNERLEKEVLPAVEQLELQLRRKVEGNSASIRNPAADPVPAGYGDKVAEYFRRLSKSK